MPEQIMFTAALGQSTDGSVIHMVALDDGSIYHEGDLFDPGPIVDQQGQRGFRMEPCYCDLVDRCGRLTMVPMGKEKRARPEACDLEHGHRGPHQARVQDGALGWWVWCDGAPSDHGPSLADQILAS